ncbi:MAG: peptidoglycan DD-metalloendopeptidase family protein [Syntrophomonadaceae bacterium]|nr:peptidoglycan DD-metalloendopeptidase family protein [Syntrophomonadaceae bacterium]MDD3024383.1 peptidoglycan DD-metalloendopeptidase family protein [Syntrophomonadaceae bacterium]
MLNKMQMFLQQEKHYIMLETAVLLLLVLWLSSLLGIKVPAYAVYVDKQMAFVVQDPEQLNNLIDKKLAREKKVTHKDVQFTNNLDYRRVFVSQKQLAAGQELEENMAKYVHFETPATAIMADGKTVALVRDHKTAEQILKSLKKEYSWVDEGEKLLGLDFAEKVKLKEVKVSARNLMDESQAYRLIKTGTDNPEKYIVKSGDSLWLIARRNDMYVNDIVVANQLKTENLALGQELLLLKSKPYINVIAKVEGNKVEAIPFEVEVLVDKNAVSGIRVKQDGKDGEKQVVYVATKLNGITDKREIKQETILKAAVKKVIVKGSKVTMVASRGGSGNLEWPSYGIITQYYRGKGHTGIDIGARSGTTIRAADSGYVSSASYQGGYGRFIIIDHNNGLVTRYAHCSSMNVSEGQNVVKGQAIGTVGSTGRSTGPHLHFEVLSGGSFRNPLDYLR